MRCLRSADEAVVVAALNSIQAELTHRRTAPQQTINEMGKNTIQRCNETAILNQLALSKNANFSLQAKDILDLIGDLNIQQYFPMQ